MSYRSIKGWYTKGAVSPTSGKADISDPFCLGHGPKGAYGASTQAIRGQGRPLRERDDCNRVPVVSVSKGGL